MSAPNKEVSRLLGHGLGSYESLVAGLGWMITQVSTEAADEHVQILQPLADVLAEFDKRPEQLPAVTLPVRTPEPVQMLLFRAGLALCGMRQLTRTGEGDSAAFEDLRARVVSHVKDAWALITGEVLG